jgi:thymidylate synthase
MNNVDKEYFRLLDSILRFGRVKKNRTGVDTIGIFGEQAKFNLQEGFPLLTTKKVFFKGIVHELLWFIKGDTNIKYLVDNGVHIWDSWCFKRYKDALARHPENTFEVNPTGDLGGNRWHSSWTMERFIQEIKDDKNFATLWGNLGEGTYGGMWRDFPYFTEGGNGDYVDYGWGFQKSTHTFGGVDQLNKVINKLQTNPDDRRMIVSAWHPYWVDHCALPPCHVLFHFNTEELTEKERVEWWVKNKSSNGMYVPVVPSLLGEDVPKRRLNLLLYQRSCDTFLGVPFNIASYALLLEMVAHCVNMVPGNFVHTYGDLHLYNNSIEAAKLQLTRKPFPLPTLKLNPDVKDIFKFKYEDITLDNYQCHPAIKVAVAV